MYIFFFFEREKLILKLLSISIFKLKILPALYSR